MLCWMGTRDWELMFEPKQFVRRLGDLCWTQPKLVLAGSFCRSDAFKAVVEKGVQPVDWPRELALVGKMLFYAWHIGRTYS